MHDSPDQTSAASEHGASDSAAPANAYDPRAVEAAA